MHQERKSWFEKNWWWSIPSCCLGCLVLIAGSCAALVGGAFLAVRSSSPLEDALERVRADPAIVEALGEPIESGWQFQGQLNTENGRTVAEFTIPISGPLGEALLRVKGERRIEDWDYEVLEVDLDDGRTIDLLEPRRDRFGSQSEI